MTTTTASRWSRWALYLLLGAWFAATVVSSEPRRKFEQLRRFDPIGCYLPEWRFFAPRPGEHDIHLLVRDELDDGYVTDWHDAAGHATRRLHHLVWNTSIREQKVVLDCLYGLQNFSTQVEHQPELIQLSLPYLRLLSYASYQMPHHARARRTQFVLVAAKGWDERAEPTVVFLSSQHDLP
jgi:hypothetical protein